MKCPHCQAQAPEEAKTCPSCGRHLFSEDETVLGSVREAEMVLSDQGGVIARACENLRQRFELGNCVVVIGPSVRFIIIEPGVDAVL